MNTTSEVIKYLEDIYSTLNKELFNSQLPPVNIELSHTDKNVEDASPKKVEYSDGSSKYIIQLNEDTLSLPIESLVLVLLHNCIHLYAWKKGIQESSRAGAYHNKRFKKIATALEIPIVYDPKYGWSKLGISDQLITYIKNHNWKSIKVPKTETRCVTSKSSTRKLQCPVCGNSVRATKDVNIICGDCNVKMEVVTKQ